MDGIKSIKLGYMKFGEKPVIEICSHISVLGKETGQGNGEYQEELNVFCKSCNKWYNYIIEIGI